MFFNALGNGPRVLDGFAVHVGDVQAAVGRVGELHGPEPVIRRGNELALLLVLGSHGNGLHAVVTQQFAMDKITAGIGNERVAAKSFAQRVAAINRDARGRREIAGYATAALHRPAHRFGDAPARADDAPRFVGA